MYYIVVHGRTQPTIIVGGTVRGSEGDFTDDDDFGIRKRAPARKKGTFPHDYRGGSCPPPPARYGPVVSGEPKHTGSIPLSPKMSDTLTISKCVFCRFLYDSLIIVCLLLEPGNNSSSMVCDRFFSLKPVTKHDKEIVRHRRWKVRFVLILINPMTQPPFGLLY